MRRCGDATVHAGLLAPSGDEDPRGGLDVAGRYVVGKKGPAG